MHVGEGDGDVHECVYVSRTFCFFKIHLASVTVSVYSLLQNLFEIEIFCNIINVFTVIFYQFNVPFLNKSFNFFNCFYSPQTFEQYNVYPILVTQ